MLTIILLATIVPILTGAAYVTIRNRFPQRVADIRGIALQTVIVIVVMLAIAGAVAGVLLTRGSEAVSELEDQEIDLKSEADDKDECDLLGGKLGSWRVHIASPSSAWT